MQLISITKLFGFLTFFNSIYIYIYTCFCALQKSVRNDMRARESDLKSLFFGGGGWDYFKDPLNL